MRACLVIGVVLGGAPALWAADELAGVADSVVLVPTSVVLPEAGRTPAEEGVLLVRENRAAPRSRTIAVHFWRFRGRRPDMAPVFYLPGGPGSAVARGPGRPAWDGYPGLESAWGESLITELTAGGDLIFVNQRGNASASLQPDMRVEAGAGLPADRVPTAGEKTKALRIRITESCARWTDRGVDLAGYDFPNIVEDLEELRRALGYETIKLHAGSFGSQWSLGYLRRYGTQVERAALFGVEPLDHTYDSPAGLWAAITRLAQEIDADPRWRATFPHGVLAALEGVRAWLLSAPVTVDLPESAGRIAIDWSDVQEALLTPDRAASPRHNLELWPQFIAEMARGDFHRVARRAMANRRGPVGLALILPLVDHSLGISAERDARYAAEAAQVPLGETNALYRALAGRLPTGDVGDAWRARFAITCPLLLVQGDMDVSTPCENAVELMADVMHGHLMRVHRGTHNVMRELARLRPELSRRVTEFLLAPDEQLPALLAAMPDHTELPPLEFTAPPSP